MKPVTLLRNTVLRAIDEAAETTHCPHARAAAKEVHGLFSTSTGNRFEVGLVIARIAEAAAANQHLETAEEANLERAVAEAKADALEGSDELHLKPRTKGSPGS